MVRHVQRNVGNVEVTSDTSGKGATFLISLPITFWCCPCVQ